MSHFQKNRYVTLEWPFFIVITPGHLPLNQFEIWGPFTRVKINLILRASSRKLVSIKDDMGSEKSVRNKVPCVQHAQGSMLCIFNKSSFINQK